MGTSKQHFTSGEGQFNRVIKRSRSSLQLIQPLKAFTQHASLSVCRPSRRGPRQERPGGGVAHRGQPPPQAPLPAAGHPRGPGPAPAPPARRPVRLVGLPVRQVPGAAADLAGEGDPAEHRQAGLQAPHHRVRAPHLHSPFVFLTPPSVCLSF